MMDTNKLYEVAREVWGDDLQINLAVEECAELIVALQHWRRRGPQNDVGEMGCGDVVCGEIADVMILAEQLSVIFGPERVMARKAFKLARLEHRLRASGVDWPLEDHSIDGSCPYCGSPARRFGPSEFCCSAARLEHERDEVLSQLDALRSALVDQVSQSGD